MVKVIFDKSRANYDTNMKFSRDVCLYDGLYAYVMRVYMNACVLILDACKCSVNILIVCVVLDSC